MWVQVPSSTPFLRFVQLRYFIAISRIKNRKSNKNKAPYRDKAFLQIENAIDLLENYLKLHRKIDIRIPQSINEALNITEFYCKKYIEFYINDLQLLLKIDQSTILSGIEKRILSNYINRRTFDTVSRLLYVSQLEIDDRGVFIVAQLLGDVYKYSKNERDSETYITLNSEFRNMVKTLLSEKMIIFPKSTGLSKKYLIKHNLAFPPTEQILEQHLVTYVSEHKNISLTKEQMYDDYSMLSDAIHIGLTAGMASEHISEYRDIAGISVRTRMMIEIVNSYYFYNTLDNQVEKWLSEFFSINKYFQKEWLEKISLNNRKKK